MLPNDNIIRPQGNTEIDKALKQFETQSSAPLPQQHTAQATGVSDTPRIVRIVMKLSGGLIKEQRQAEYLILGFIIVMVGISLFLFFGGGPTAEIPSLPGLGPIIPANRF